MLQSIGSVADWDRSAPLCFPEMRKPTTNMLFAIGVGIAIAASLIGLQPVLSPTGCGVSLSARLAESDHSTGCDVFYVTNNGPYPIEWAFLEVEVAINDCWQTVSRKPLRCVDPSAPNISRLEAGSYRPVLVVPPEEGPWRVRVIIQPERHGLGALLMRAKVAWRSRSLSVLGLGPVPDEAQEVVSCKIPQ